MAHKETTLSDIRKIYLSTVAIKSATSILIFLFAIVCFTNYAIPNLVGWLLGAACIVGIALSAKSDSDVKKLRKE